MRSLAPLALAYIVLRALLLWTNFDATCMPNYELAPMGQLAWLGGPRGPEFALGRFYDNCGGHLVTGLLASPLYVILDDRYLALKLVTLLFGLATLTLLWRALDRHFGRRSATVFGWSFALGTPALFQASAIAMGNHYEGLLAQALILVAFLDARAQPTPRRCAYFGFALAAGAFLYFGTLALSAPALVVFFLARERRNLRAARSVLTGLAVGVVPLLWAQLASGARPGRFLDRLFGESSGVALAEARGRAAEFLTEHLPRATSTPEVFGLDGKWFDFLFTALAALVWLGALWKLRSDRRLAPLVLYLPLVIAVVAFSRIAFHAIPTPLEVVGRRYFFSFQLFTLILAAVGAGTAQRVRFRTTVALLALVTLPSLGHLRLAPDESGHARAYVGVHLPYFAGPIMRDAFDDDARMLARLERLPANARAEAARGVGHHTGWLHLAPLPPADQVPRALELIARWPERWQRDVARGFGTFWRRGMQLDGTASAGLPIVLAALAQVPEPLRGAIVEGLALEFEYPLVRLLDAQLARTLAIARVLPGGLEDGLWHGHGEACGVLLARGLATDIQRVAVARKRLPAFWTARFLEGARAGWSRTTDAPLPATLLPHDLPQE